MSGIEVSAVNQTLKTSKGFIDALLKPKLKTVEEWVDEKQFNKLLSLDSRKLLKIYLERTIVKSYEVSTIVFPQHKVPLKDIYVPLELKQSTYQGSKFSPKTDIDLNSNGKCYFIIDHAGMGKSTYSKNLTLDLIAFSNKVPIFFELSSYVESYTLLENLAQQLDEIDSKFDRKLFEKMIKAGKFFIILDGYDELHSNHEYKVRNEIKQLSERKRNSSLLLTSRPQESFPDLMGVTKYKISKMNVEQATSLLMKYDNFCELHISKALVPELTNIPKEFTKTPLLLSLLYKTYSYNNSVAKTVTAFYKEIFEALYKGHDLTKSGFVRQKRSNLDIDKFRELLQSFSFVYLLNQSDLSFEPENIVQFIEDAKELCGQLDTVARDFLHDLLTAVPLMFKDGMDVKYVHRTLAEYFSAEYISLLDDHEEMLTQIFESDEYPTFSKTIEFIGEIKEHLYNKVITKPISEKYVESYNDKLSPIINTCLFFSLYEISIWKETDVKKYSKAAKRRIFELPSVGTRLNSDKYCYFLGTSDNARYVIFCKYISRNIIPPKAYETLSEAISLDGLEPHRMDNVDIKGLIDKFGINKWQLVDSSCIDLLALQEILITVSNIYIEESKNYCSAFTVAKCKKLINTVKATTEKRRNISLLINKKNH